MRRSRSPASSYCSASGRDNSDWDVWAFKVKLRLRSGTPYLALEVSAAQKGSEFARDGYLQQSRPIKPAEIPTVSVRRVPIHSDPSYPIRAPYCGMGYARGAPGREENGYAER